MNGRKFIPVLLILLLTGGSLIFHYQQAIFSANTTVMGDSMDGLKNYFTPWYHVAHDESYFWFDGMNYPHGEHPVFADAQPLVSNLIRFVSRNIVDISDYTLGILNLLLFGGVLWSAWLIFLILKRFRVEAVFAAISASVIVLLAPQMLKLTGHYALGYAFAVPLIWYLSLRFFEQPGWKSSLLIAGAAFLLAWIHPYYLMISAVFLTALALFHWLFQKNKLSLPKRFLHLAVQVILPGLAFGLLLKLTDPVTDRPGNPYGFEEYIATWRTVFLPYAIPWLDWVKRFQTDIEQNWEGVAYVGIAGVFAFLLFWFRVGRRIVRRLMGGRLPGRRMGWISRQPLVAVSVGAGLLVLLFACGFPFSYKPELMTDLFPPIKQFRSLGRFAWVFYYTWTVFTFYLLWLSVRYHRIHKRKILAYSIAGLVFALCFAEGLGYNQALAGRINRVIRPQMVHDGKDSPWISLINPEKYSAIIALPFFHEGSENFTTDNAVSYAVAFETSVKTGLPLLNVMMSRSSLSHTWSLFQLTTSPYRPLEILSSITDKRPILAVRMGNFRIYDEEYLQPRKPFLYRDKDVSVYEIDFASLQKEMLCDPPPATDTLIKLKGELFSEQAGTVFFAEDFEEGDAEGIAGTKGKTILLKDNNELFKGKLDGLHAGDTLILSLWMKLKGDRLAHTMFGWEEHGQDGGNVSWSYPATNKFMRVMDGDWALCEREVVVQNPDHELMVNVTRWKRKPPELVIDQFLIRKKGDLIFRMQNDRIIEVNNRDQQGARITDEKNRSWLKEISRCSVRNF
jgi:hypothetical protein